MITAELANITVSRGDFVFFNVSINTSQILEEEFIYQWQGSGLNLVEMPDKLEGVNTSVLTIIDARNEDEDSYQCVIYNGVGDSVKSNEAFLSVGKLLFKDYFITFKTLSLM